MAIKESILTAHPEATSAQYCYRDIFIADFSRRTNSVRSVEISAAPQLCPISGGIMDSAVFHNPSFLNVEFVQYDDYVFHDVSGNNIKHCEGTLFPANFPNIKWIVMLELKDCEPRNIMNHAAKAQQQILNVTNDLRTRGILSTEIVFGIYSCPRLHTDFNSLIFGDIIQQTQLKRRTGITFVGTNEVLLIDKDSCSPQNLL